MARSNGRRNLNIPLKKPLLLTVLLFFILGCNNHIEKTGFDQQETEAVGISIFGQTQGTTYAVLCNDRIGLQKDEIDSILTNFDSALSTYIPNSIISKFNESKAGAFFYKDPYGYFNKCFSLSQSIYEKTNGAFDPSVFPLLEMWGFLKKVSNIPDSIDIRNTMKITNFKPNYHYVFKPNNNDSMPSKITKRTSKFKIVFNAIAQGQAVDVLCDFLEQKGAKNYFVEIGGEVKVKGVNDQGNIWSIGIDKPIDNSTAQNRELMEIIELDDKAVATSGNYRQFYENDGIKYSHTLDPSTGYPVKHQLLSATVVSSSCALADAYATAFMVMGTDKSIEFIKANSNLGLELMLIYNTDAKFETYTTEGFQNIIKL